ncbi:alpha-1B adrenergic receptor-like [Clytia hemisphaerica]|uniref:alpha-1B adrenergic receptor-like n=1 Tax=Clytia hemisphaerica TaxID=252671 RepID=UPI0034D5DC26
MTSDCSNADTGSDAAIALFISFIALSVLAIVGNFLIILVVVCDPLKKLHTPFNYFLVNLSVCDFIAGAVPMPLTAYYMYTSLKGLNITFSPLEESTTIASAASVILSTCALAIDRYVGITHPLKYRIKLSWVRCIVISIIIWVLSIGVGCLVTFIGNRRYGFAGFYYGAIAIGFFVIAFVYFGVHRFMKSNEEEFKKRLEDSLTANRKTIAQRYIKEKRVTRVFFIILAVFMISYIPGLAFLNVMYYCKQCSCKLKYDLYHTRYLLSVSNSAVNPYIFIALMKSFRESIKALFTPGRVQEGTRSPRTSMT